MRIALAMIVKGSDEEAKILNRALANAAPHVDGIFITRTQLPNESKNKAVENVCKKYKAHLSDFEWVYDFSKARNFNFLQVPKEYDYILWMDADDQFRGIEKLKNEIKKSPTADAFGMWYLYDWDEFKKPTVVHKKTMIVRNDNSARWEGEIHEDLIPNRALNVVFLKSVDRLHMTDSVRTAESKTRNLEIATRAMKGSEDPKDTWNMGNALFGMGKYEEAEAVFKKFIQDSGSDQERYIAHLRLADVYKSKDESDMAIREMQVAIGLAPSIPDAYLQLAYMYFILGNNDRAESYSLQGLMRRPVPHAMIVYNPRDYDYNPLMLLAQIYSRKNRPDLMLPLLKGCLKIYPTDEKLKEMVREGQKEKNDLGKALRLFNKLGKIRSEKKLVEALDALPEKMKSHPAIAVLRNKRLVKKTSSGRDLVIYCGGTAQVWNPRTFENEGVGGSEEAVIHLAREYAKLGWWVTVYNNCGNRELFDPVRVKHEKGDWGNIAENHEYDSLISYRPYWQFNPRDKQDVVIVWRHPRVLDANINATKIFVDMHDVIPAGEFTDLRLSKITKVMVKSHAHRILFPNIPDEKIAIVPNGFMDYESKIQRDPFLIINTSSPDRSMDVLPKLFTEIKKRVPQAKMAWAYGWDVFKSSNQNEPKMMRWMQDILKDMKDAGIQNLGRLPQKKVGELYHKAAILAYPTEFYEISCISVLKAQGAGCLPITTDFAALKESNKYGKRVHSIKDHKNWNRPYQFHFGLEDEKSQKLFIETVVAALKSNAKIGEEDSQNIREEYAWSKIAEQWNALLK